MYQVNRRKFIGLAALLLILLAVLGIGIYLISQQVPDFGVGLADRNDGRCVIGWTNSHQGITAGTVSGYIPYQTLNAAKPTDATIKVFDLNGGTGSLPLTTTNLADVDILFVSDQGDNGLRTNYVNPTAAQLNILKGEFTTGMRIVAASDNGGSAPGGGSYAAMMTMPIVNNLGTGLLSFRDAIIRTEQTTGVSQNTEYPFLSGYNWTTVGTGFWTPGIVTATAPAVCAASATYTTSGGGTACLLSYAPPSGNQGFMLVDTNGGQMVRPMITDGTIWEQVPDCAPAPPIQCGNGIVETGETCDAGTSNGMACTAPYAGSCTYCTNECQEANVPGPFCGDGVRNGTEECDGQDVGEGMQCSTTCTILDPLTVSKASTIQSINSAEAVVQYTITVTNPNSEEILSMVVSDQLPSFVQQADITNISNDGAYDSTARTITWEQLRIPANGNVALTYNLRVTSANYGSFDNVAIVYDSENNEDNRDTETVTLDPDIQANINKTHTQQLIDGNTAVTYTVNVQNSSGIQLIGVRVVDTLPTGIQASWVSGISNGGVLSGNTITWSGISLNADQSVSYTYTITYPAGTAGTFTNTVEVFDSNNNELSEDSDTVTLTPPSSSTTTSSSSTSTSTTTSSSVSSSSESSTTTTTPSSSISSSISSTPASSPTSSPSLPDTALTDQPSELILFGFTLIIIGGIAYKFGIGTGIGKTVVNFTNERASEVVDTINPEGFESGAERSLRKKISRKTKK